MFTIQYSYMCGHNSEPWLIAEEVPFERLTPALVVQELFPTSPYRAFFERPLGTPAGLHISLEEDLEIGRPANALCLTLERRSPHLDSPPLSVCGPPLAPTTTFGGTRAPAARDPPNHYVMGRNAEVQDHYSCGHFSVIYVIPRKQPARPKEIVGVVEYDTKCLACSLDELASKFTKAQEEDSIEENALNDTSGSIYFC